MGNRVEFGLEQVHIAFLDREATTSPAWQTPIPIPGAVRFIPEPQGEESKFYADNGLYFTEVTNDGYVAELEVALFPDTVLAEMLGWLIDDNGMLVEIADGIPKEFALLAQMEGDQKPRRFVYYRCKASRPTKEIKSKGEGGVEVATDKLSMTILPIEVEIDTEKKRVVKGTLEKDETNAAVFDTFFGDVLLPTVTSVLP